MYLQQSENQRTWYCKSEVQNIGTNPFILVPSEPDAHQMEPHGGFLMLYISIHNQSKPFIQVPSESDAHQMEPH